MFWPFTKKYELWIAYNEDDKVLDENFHLNLDEKSSCWPTRFIVNKKIKITPKHIKFKDHEDRLVEIKAVKPMNYMIRDLKK